MYDVPGTPAIRGSKNPTAQEERLGFRVAKY